MPLGDTVPLNRPGDSRRASAALERDYLQLNAALTPQDLPLTAVFVGVPLSGVYDPTVPVAQSTTRVQATTDTSGLIVVQLDDTMTAVLSAHPTELLAAAGATPLKLYVRPDLAAADAITLQAVSVVDGTTKTSTAVDAFLTITYQP